MADVNMMSTPQRGEYESSSVEARFAQFCKNDLQLDEGNFMEETAKLLNDSMNLMSSNLGAIGAATLDEAERYWFVFIIYSVRRLSESIGTKEKGLSLCRILRAATLNIVDFYKELHQYLLKVGPTLSNLYGAEWAKRIEAKESEANFVHLTVLSQKYQRAYQELFVAMDSKNEKGSTYTSDYYRFGWLLFLALREHVFCTCKDLVTCTHGLVSVLAVLFIHVPTRFRNLKLSDSEHIVKKGEKVDLLATLCNMYKTSEDDLRDTFVKVNNLITQLLNRKPCLASECKFNNLDKIATDGLVHFDDLMDGSSLSTAIDLLDKDYEAVTKDNCELDERIFINEDTLLASGSLSGGAVHINGNGVKRTLDLISSPTKTVSSPLSPFRSPGNGMPKILATPVSTAMNTAKWLRTVVAPLPPKPSAELERFLVSCDKDVTADVMKRAHIILKAIFMENILAEQRRLEAMKLYFRVLQAMCVAESQILHATNLTSLLTNERFHRCMLACSSELVLATHKTVTMLFPAVLEKTGITAFDLTKVIESFVRHDESLPRELRRHLNSLEERLLDSMVWEKGSSMYNSLIVARPTLSAEITRLGLLAEPMPSLDAIAVHVDKSCGVSQPVQSTLKHERFGQNGDMRSPKRLCTEYRSALVERNSFTSPVKERFLALNSNLKSKFPQPVLQSAFASPNRPHPGGGGETCAETAVNVFFSKILKLAAVRINGMVERLQLSQQIKESVYDLFQKILVQLTNIFFCRHIDQIILCSLYGISKISQLNLTFKEIIFNYRKQPHCKQQVFRNVFVERRQKKSGPDHVDIITFYNEIFIPSVKPLLVEFASNASGQVSPLGSKGNSSIDGPCPASPKPSPFPNLPDMSPKKVSAVHNVYVSPLRSSKMDALISHSSKSYYACVGESTRAYQSPSKDLSSINTRLNGNRKLKGALNFDDVDAGLVTDSVVASSLYVANGSTGPVKSEVPES